MSRDFHIILFTFGSQGHVFQAFLCHSLVENLDKFINFGFSHQSCKIIMIKNEIKGKNKFVSY